MTAIQSKRTISGRGSGDFVVVATGTYQAQCIGDTPTDSYYVRDQHVQMRKP
jgi:hypothetical protein